MNSVQRRDWILSFYYRYQAAIFNLIDCFVCSVLFVKLIAPSQDSNRVDELIDAVLIIDHVPIVIRFDAVAKSGHEAVLNAFRAFHLFGENRIVAIVCESIIGGWIGHSCVYVSVVARGRAIAIATSLE